MTRAGKKTLNGHMARFNALVRGGWLRVLSDQEMRLWMAYSSFADREGVAWPDGQTLSEIIGHAADNHISATRRAMVEYGLLEVVEAGGGRGRPCKIRLLTPPSAEGLNEEKPSQKPSRKHSLKPSRTGSVYETETLPIGEKNPPDSGVKPSRLGSAYKDELNQELNQELNNPRAAVPSGREIECADGGEKHEPEDPHDGGGIVMVPIEPKGTRFPPGVWRQACEGVMKAYEHVHGVKPIFKSRGWKAFAEILVAVKGDVGEFGRIVKAGLCEPQKGIWEGHPPWIILEKLNYLRSKIARGGQVPVGTQAAGKSRIEMLNEALDREMSEVGNDA